MLNLEINEVSEGQYEIVCGKKKYIRNPIGDFDITGFKAEQEIDEPSIFNNRRLMTPRISNGKLELKLTNIKSLERYSEKFNITITTKDIKFEFFNCIVTGCEMCENMFEYDTATLTIQFDYYKKSFYDNH